MKLLKYFGFAAFAWLLIYLLGSFFMTDFNIAEWYEGVRMAAVLFAIVPMIACLPALMEM